MMIVALQRIQNYLDFSLGTLHVDGRLIAYTLEDEKRTVKKWGEMRIPAGTYKITLRRLGRIHESYKKRFPWHDGVLHITNIPNFKYVYIHIGNDDDDTAGCPLVGNSSTIDKNFISQSTQAYERLYKVLYPELKKGNDVIIRVIDELVY